MVLLRYADPFADNPFKCAGTLITKFTVLSAAHCLPKRDTMWVSLDNDSGKSS